MARAQWGVEPEFFGPRHAHREKRILRALKRAGYRPDGIHLECAAGLGSLSIAIAAAGGRVVAADLSLPSLLAIRRRYGPKAVLPVMADITALPFPDAGFDSATTAETLEHIPDDAAAAGELARVLRAGGILAGTVPADPGQWSDWDVWADHKRRYSRQDMEQLLRHAGLDVRVVVWGWPILRVYDEFFLKRVNRRRLKTEGPAEKDPGLKRIAGLGKKTFLVRTVELFFELDRIFDGFPWGVGLLFTGRKPTEPVHLHSTHGATRPQEGEKLDRASSSVS